MKSLFATAALVLAATPAIAIKYFIVLEKKMPVAECDRAIADYVQANGYTTELFGQNDYFIMENGQRVGNAYYSQETCYIYLDM